MTTSELAAEQDQRIAMLALLDHQRQTGADSVLRVANHGLPQANPRTQQQRLQPGIQKACHAAVDKRA